MTARSITCRPRPILVSRWRLATYKRLVSKFELGIVSAGEAKVAVSAGEGLGLGL